MKALEVKSLPGYKLFLSFEDGIKGVLDLSSLVEEGIFKALKEEYEFSNVHLTGYSIAWSEELEIDLLAAYAELADKDPQQVIPSISDYAAD